MNDALLILNAGSSSIKFALYRATAFPQHADLLCDGQLSGIGHAIHFQVTDANGSELQNSTMMMTFYRIDGLARRQQLCQ